MGKVVGENGLMIGGIDRKTEDGLLPKPGEQSYEVEVQSRVNTEGVREYYVTTSDGHWLEGMGTKRLIFDKNKNILWTQMGSAMLDVGYHQEITKPDERRVFLQALVAQLRLDIPELAPPETR